MAEGVEWYVACYGGSPARDQWSFDLEPFHKGERFLHLIDTEKFTSREVALNSVSYHRGYFPYSNSSVVVVLMHGRTPKRIVQYQLSEE